jgi:SAM-dependent methyltransferase
MLKKKNSTKIDINLGTPERFGYAWNIASKIKDVNEDQFLNWTKVIKNKNYWKGKDILDAGCGIGRNTYWPISYGAKSAIAFDMDDRTLKAAKNNLEKHKNVKIEKHSIYEIPYTNKFDISFSIGVVHHLEFPNKAISELVKSTKPGGKVLVWLYGYENMETYVTVLNPIRKILFSKAPLPLVRIISYIPTFFLLLYIWSGFSKLEYFKLLRKLKFSEIQQIVFDQMLPKTAKYYKKNEALTLLEHAELYDHKIEWVNECSWTVMATKKN